MTMLERDFEKFPYTPDELKVVRYLQQTVPDIGAGDDPIQFLIASHSALRMELASFRINLKDRNEEDPIPWVR